MKLTYNTLYELPLKNYIDCVVDDNYRSLLRYSVPYPKWLLRALFSKLQKQYIELSNNKDYGSKKALVDSLNEMKIKLYLYNNALQLISDYDDMHNAMKYLKEEGFSGSRESVIKRVTQEVKVMTLQVELKESEYLAQYGSNDSVDEKGDKVVKKVTRKDYATTIVNINMNIESGYSVTYETSVADFIITINAQKEKAKRIEQQLNKRR